MRLQKTALTQTLPKILAHGLLMGSLCFIAIALMVFSSVIYSGESVASLKFGMILFVIAVLPVYWLAGVCCSCLYYLIPLHAGLFVFITLGALAPILTRFIDRLEGFYSLPFYGLSLSLFSSAYLFALAYRSYANANSRRPRAAAQTPAESSPDDAAPLDVNERSG